MLEIEIFRNVDDAIARYRLEIDVQHLGRYSLIALFKQRKKLLKFMNSGAAMLSGQLIRVP